MRYELANPTDFSDLTIIQVSESSQQCNFFWIEDGVGSFILDDQEELIVKDTVYCFWSVHCPFLVNADRLKGYVISFPMEFFQQVKNSMNLHFNYRLFDRKSMSLVRITGAEKAEMAQLLFCMGTENRVKSEFRGEILCSLLRVFLIRLIQKMVGEGAYGVRQPEKDQLVNRFIGMVYEHFSTLKRVSDYADILCIAPSYLNTRVKAVTGFTASSLIKEVIIAEAKKQVWQNGLSLKEVAYHLGYEDTSHFSKFFKREAGTNYSNFKREIPEG